MKLEILMSCMHQVDDELVHRSGITGDVVMINQCDREDYAEYNTKSGKVRVFSTRQRGLTKGRNMAIANAQGDICLLCDDDETFVPDYEKKILDTYRSYPQADVLIFKIENIPSSLPARSMRLRFPMTMKVCSVQVSFRRDRLVRSGIRFDELLGAGTGNGGEEELKFLLDCENAGLRIYYVPVVIASVKQESSTWYDGFTERFFENRGATTRYILGAPLAALYGVYYILRKHALYGAEISPMQALSATFRGIRGNRITKIAKETAHNEMLLQK